jgi:hypothetical protein
MLILVVKGSFHRGSAKGLLGGKVNNPGRTIVTAGTGAGRRLAATNLLSGKALPTPVRRNALIKPPANPACAFAKRLAKADIVLLSHDNTPQAFKRPPNPARSFAKSYQKLSFLPGTLIKAPIFKTNGEPAPSFRKKVIKSYPFSLEPTKITPFAIEHEHVVTAVTIFHSLRVSPVAHNPP